MFFPAAPWPGLLYVMTGFGTVLLLGLTLVLGGQESTRLVAGAPFAVWVLCAVYMVRGFRLEGQTLYIKRLFQETAIPLQGLEKAEHKPAALMDARRTLGNGGLFAFTGHFSNATLGSFRMYATDPALAVTLYLPDRIVVVTPANTAAFLKAVQHPEPVAMID